MALKRDSVVHVAALAGAGLVLAARPAHATDFLEWRAAAAAQAGDDRLAVDAALGAAYDVYLDGKKGLRAGGDALLVSFPRDATPGLVGIAPDVALWFGADGATRRWFVTLRPMTFRLVDFREGGAGAALYRFEAGGEHEWRASDGGLRFRVGMFYAPGADFGDATWHGLAASLRVTLAWARPPEGPPPARPLPGE